MIAVRMGLTGRKRGDALRAARNRERQKPRA
jgi:hypothetical protein